MLDALHQAHVRKICERWRQAIRTTPDCTDYCEKLALLLPFRHQLSGGAGPALLQDGPPFAGQPVSGTVL